jgi:fused signal recognition particle receptor
VIALYVLIGVVAVALLAGSFTVVRARKRRALDAHSRTPLESGTATSAAPAAPAEVATTTPTPDATEVVAPPVLATQLGQSRSLFARVRELRGRSTVGTEELAALEEALLRADVGTQTTTALLDEVKAAAAARTMGADGVTGALRTALLDLLGAAPSPLATKVDDDRVAVWLFVGVNGVGKTTTIGKLAAAEARAGNLVLLAAADTFRAAAADQLEVWAERVGADLVRADEGADPGAVVHDALHRAASRGIRLVLADTAGRLHNKANLIEELKKIRRVADRAPGAVTEVLLVLDATTGQNAVSQAREFKDAVDVTGIVLTKLDGTARGGVVLAVQRELGVPVRLVGVGERPEDLVAFDPEAFVDALLGE